MKVQCLRYARKFNLGNYQTEEVEITMDVDGEKAEAVMAVMKKFVLSQSTEQQKISSATLNQKLSAGDGASCNNNTSLPPKP